MLYAGIAAGLIGGHKFLFRNWKKFCMAILLVLFLVILLNIPMVSSYLLSGDVHKLSTYNPLSGMDSWFMGASLAGVGISQIKIMAVLFVGLLIISSLSVRSKLLLVISYLAVTFILHGGKIGQIEIYKFAFEKIPLMDHMRSLYRFIPLQMFVVFLIIYSGISRAVNSKVTLIKLGVILVVVLIFIIQLDYINSNKNLFHTTSIPSEYFDVDNYLNSTGGKKIYFPAYWSSQSPSMSSNYTWLPNVERGPTLYTNPFTSLFQVSDIAHTENNSLTPAQQELRTLVNYNRNPIFVQNALEYLGIGRVIIDKHYFWDKNFSDFDLETFAAKLTLDKIFGNLFIYKIKDLSTECIPAYGQFRLGYCYDNIQPLVFINKSAKDWVLDNLDQYKLTQSSKTSLESFITNVSLREVITTKGILIPGNIHFINNEVDNIFSQKIKKGPYKLFVPVLQLEHFGRIFGETNLDVFIGDILLTKLSPYGAYEGIRWHEFDIQIEKEEQLKIDTKGLGLIVIGDPLLIPMQEWASIDRKVNSLKSKTQHISDYGKGEVDVEINQYILTNVEKHESRINVNLLDEKYYPDVFTLKKTQHGDRKSMALTSSSDIDIMKYHVKTSKTIKELKISTGTAFVDSEENGKLQIVSPKGGILYERSIFNNGRYTESFKVPTEVISDINEFEIVVQTLRKGILIYELVLSAHF
jgi:hypothetical protein